MKNQRNSNKQILIKRTKTSGNDSELKTPCQYLLLIRTTMANTQLEQIQFTNQLLEILENSTIKTLIETRASSIRKGLNLLTTTSNVLTNTLNFNFLLSTQCTRKLKNHSKTQMILTLMT